MLDRLLTVGTAFDWISPVASIIADVANGPSRKFLIPHDCGWSGREIANLLRRRGVKSWGHMIVKGNIMITVRQRQAQWAQHILDEAGVPAETAVTDERQPTPARRLRGRSRLWDLLE